MPVTGNLLLWSRSPSRRTCQAAPTPPARARRLVEQRAERALPRAVARRRRAARDRARGQRRPARRRRPRRRRSGCCSRARAGPARRGRQRRSRSRRRSGAAAARPRAAAAGIGLHLVERARQPLGRPQRAAHRRLVRARPASSVCRGAGRQAPRGRRSPGHRLSLSNLDKVLYPEAGFTKGHVIDYYTRVAPVLLPHLRGRPLTLKRYPNGVDEPHFYEKQCPSHRPDWVRTAPICSRANGARSTSAWPTTCRRSCGSRTSPTSSCTRRSRCADDYARADGDRVRPRPRAAGHDRRVRRGRARAADDLRAPRACEAFPKTSGSKGMQVYVPLNTPATYDADAGRSRTALAAAARAPPAGARGLGDEEVAARRARCSSTGARTRAQDDRVRVLAAGAARSRPSRPR